MHHRKFMGLIAQVYTRIIKKIIEKEINFMMRNYVFSNKFNSLSYGRWPLPVTEKFCYKFCQTYIYIYAHNHTETEKL